MGGEKRLCTKGGDKSDNNVGYRNEERGREWEREGELEWGEKEKKYILSL